MSKGIGIAMVALLAMVMLVLPVSAGITTINPGDTIFIGEQGLNIEAAVPDDWIAYWAPGQSQAETPYTINVATQKTSFYVDPSEFTDRTGDWYSWNGTSNNGTAFKVQTPSIDLKIWNADTGKDVSDKSVVRGAFLTFRIDSNLHPINTRAGYVNNTDGFLTIKVKDPVGSVYTVVVGEGGDENPLTKLPLNVSTMTSLWFPDGNTVATNYWDTEAQTDTTYIYKAGSYEVWVEADPNSMKTNWNSATGKVVSTHRTVTIADDTVTITANTDSVVRGDDFSLAITGRPNSDYVLWIDGTSGAVCNEIPAIKRGQAGVSVEDDDAYYYEYKADTRVSDSAANCTGAYAMVTLDDSGKRTVGVSTSSTTNDKTYTFRVQDNRTYTVAKWDTVKVKVTKGAVTIDAEGDKVYYVGMDIKLFGENTDSERVYLFITGPNLAPNGANLDNTSQASINDDANTFHVEDVKSDNTWEYTWATSGVGLDAGTYTVWAVSQPKNKGSLADVKYASLSFQIRKAFVTAQMDATRLAKGDKLVIKGNAEGNPSEGVAIWIFGTNLALDRTESVEDDTSFKYENSNTRDWSAGQYFVVVQHPMYNNRLDVVRRDDYVVNLAQDGLQEFKIIGANRLMGSDAAEALVQVLNKPNIDDTYVKLFFMLEEGYISIDAIGDKYVGDKFTMKGTTNLAVDDALIVTITSASFRPTEKTQASEFSGASGTVKVVKGTGLENAWSFDVDTTGFKPDQYIVTIECVETGTTATTTFTVSEAPPVTPTTVPPTTAPETTAPETTAPETTTPPPTTTPGFGAFIALIGLGAVAVLVLRRH
ncbi:MAG: MEMAR_RS02690 family S-layer glycoprotein [Methanomicrobiales archaeon]|nr:MEMAR_RS02690 family S-layer glycoprotein [Methanomicrobiales archaeon]